MKKMKKIFIIATTCIMSLTACADQHQFIVYSELPVKAQTFIQTYFNQDDVTYIERDLDGVSYEYDVYLANAIEIEFDSQGSLQSIDCKRTPVPEGVVPKLITNFVEQRYPDFYIVEYMIERRNQKVELNNELELIFDREGNFQRIDD